MIDLKIGDVIRCHDKVDIIEMHNELARNGIQTDFVFERNGKQGLWLEIKQIGEKNDITWRYKKSSW